METKELKMPSGKHTVVIRNYITAQDDIEKRRTTFASLKISSSDSEIDLEKKLDKQESSAEFLIEHELLNIRRLVISVDGNKSNTYEAIMNFNRADYTFLKDELAKVWNEEQAEKKS